MSEAPNKKVIEVDMVELRRIIASQPEEVKSQLNEQINRFDRSHENYSSRSLRAEVMTQRGLNVQQHAIMQGFMKWQGTLHQMAYGLALGLSISLGGIDKAVMAMRQKSWMERNGGLLVILVVLSAVYFGYLYSPDARAAVNNFFAPITTQIGLAVVLVFMLFIWYRSRRRAAQGGQG